jgi:hypothetical protein
VCRKARGGEAHAQRRSSFHPVSICRPIHAVPLAGVRFIRLRSEARQQIQQFAQEETMSFERHHPNRQVDRNLAKARDLRSAYLFSCLAAIAEFMLGAFRARRQMSVPTRLEVAVPPIGKQSM